MIIVRSTEIASTKSKEKWTEAGGRDWDTICQMTGELSRGASAKQDVIARLLRLAAMNREKLPQALIMLC